MSTLLFSNINFVHVLILFALSIKWCTANLCLTDPSTSKVVEFSKEYPYCKIVTKSNEITDLLSEHPEQFAVINEETLKKMEETCIKKPEYGFIYPGTLWCGRGTKAAEYSQLGVHDKEDSCCREHDNCQNFLAAGECKGGICNDSKFTRSHCSCDKKFQDCLRNTLTETGNTIGAIFFNVAQLLCFQETETCDESARVLIEDRNEVTCPYEFVPADAYTFSKPYFTLKNSRAFFINLLLRNLKFWRS